MLSGSMVTSLLVVSGAQLVGSLLCRLIWVLHGHSGNSGRMPVPGMSSTITEFTHGNICGTALHLQSAEMLQLLPLLLNSSTLTGSLS